MPGDAVNSGIGFLDVQFGALDFGTEAGSLDGSATEKYNAANAAAAGTDVTPMTNVANSSNSSNNLDIETNQTNTNQYNATSQMVS